MAHLRSLPDGAVLMDVFMKRPELARPLLTFHENLLRGPSPLSVTERELIAAYVSALNACAYCQGVHTATAEAFGLEEGMLEALLRDLDDAPVDEKLKPLLRYTQKLTVTPSRMTPADADAVYAAGWDETALHDAVAVCALFNCMNRLVEGFGIVADDQYFAFSGQRLMDIGYQGLADQLDTAPSEEAETTD